MLTRYEKEQKFLLLKEKRIRKVQKDFWEFCKLLHPDFYKEDRQYLKDYCQMLQDLYNRKLLNEINNEAFTRACISFPPRHGKSRTLVLFCCWCFGQDLNNSVLYLSYSDDSAVDFSRYIRDEISRKAERANDFVFNHIFKNVRIKKGDGAGALGGGGDPDGLGGGGVYIVRDGRTRTSLVACGRDRGRVGVRGVFGCDVGVVLVAAAIADRAGGEIDGEGMGVS